MNYISETYRKQLDELAETLRADGAARLAQLVIPQQVQAELLPAPVAEYTTEL